MDNKLGYEWCYDCIYTFGNCHNEIGECIEGIKENLRTGGTGIHHRSDD
jgi:hypothetical protein